MDKRTKDTAWQYGEICQRDRRVHPPPYAPTYKTSVLRSPRNAERLLLALDQARRGEGLEMSVEELRREVLGGEDDQ